LVGDVSRVDTGVLEELLAAGRVPVVATIAPDHGGGPHNLHPDTAPGALAAALRAGRALPATPRPRRPAASPEPPTPRAGGRADRLVVLTDVPGLLSAYPDPTSLVARIGADELEELMPGLAGGMLPKMEACLRAVRGGVPVAVVADGRTPHATLRAFAGEEGF